MIQKRITICGSVQPSCSKWGWIGAILNTRLPVSLNETTCTITDTASSTNRPPTIASTISCLIATATVPSRPPIDSEPVSPMKIEAGGALSPGKPAPPPARRRHRPAREPGGKVHRVAGADNHEGTKQRESPAELDGKVLEEGKDQRGGDRSSADVGEGGDRDDGDRRLDEKPRAAGKARVRLLG